MAQDQKSMSAKATSDAAVKPGFITTLGQLRRALIEVPKASWIPTLCLSIFVTVSFIGTYTGMLRILESGDNSFGVWGRVGIFLFILATTILMAYSVKQIFMRGHRLLKRISLILTYLITVLISMSFGFAFYWSQLEARSQATSEAEKYLKSFNWELRQADVKLRATQNSLLTLQQEFTDRAAQEFDTGNQCGDSSGRGDGPRWRHLNARANAIDAIVKNLEPRIKSVREESDLVLVEIDKVSALGDKTANETTPEEREKIFRDAARSADNAGVIITELATSEGVKNNIENFRLWAAEYNDPSLVRTEPGSNRRFQCHNTGIGSQLTAIASELESLPVFTITELKTYAGAEATREALDRFWYSLVQPIRKISGSADTETQDEREDAIRRAAIADALGDQGASPDGDEENLSSRDIKKIVSAKQGLQGSDTLPMGIAFIVDFLLLLSAVWSKPVQRFEAFMRVLKEFDEMEKSPLGMVENARELANDPDFAFLRKYLFVANNEDHVAVPVGLAARSSDSVLMNNLMIAWRQGDIAMRVHMSDKAIRKQLIRSGSVLADTLDMKTAQFDAFRFKKGAFESLVMKGLVDLSRLREGLGEDGAFGNEEVPEQELSEEENLDSGHTEPPVEDVVVDAVMDRDFEIPDEDKENEDDPI